MKTRLLLIALVALALPLRAATPAEKLLPSETLAFFTVPDMNKARAEWKKDPMTQLWNDPSMKAFSDKFEAGIRLHLLVPIEKELGAKLEEYTDLAQGQLTLAVLNSPDPRAPFDPHGVLIVDAGNKAPALAGKLGELKAKLTATAKPHKIQTVRGVEFISMGKQGKGGEVHFGQAGDLLLVGDHLPTLERVIARQGENPGPGVGENIRFATRQGAQFRDALIYGWVDCEPLVKALIDGLGKNMPQPSPENPMAIHPARIANALGLNGLKAMAVSMHSSPEGGLAEIFLDVPADGRRGLFSLLGTEARDSAPPVFVGANVSKFARWRQDLPRFWNNVTGMANEISPFAGAMISFFEGSVREKDPAFNLQTQLIANLGDDVVVVEQSPRGGNKLEDLLTSNAIFLVGSPKPEAVAKALRTMMSVTGNEPQVREIEGRTIYSFGGAAAGVEDSGPKPRDTGIHLAAAPGYVAVGTDLASLQNYLRGAKNEGKTLKDMPGLAAAAQKVGGMNTGSFGYENYRETMRGMWQTLQKNPNFINDLMGLGGVIKKPKAGTDVAWIDLAALPPFEKVERYLYFWVYGMKATPEGFQIRYFGPTPPAVPKK
ncbi:MAG: hypothetical protein EXS29_01670 [Pedosphaera sp.]|nr:hypothetical protein [Pedosphaera sp.]